jgi:hypothetical protein
MCMPVSVGLHYFSYSGFDFKRWCWGDSSHTSSSPIFRRPAACPVTSSYLPLVALFAASMADLAMVPPGLPWPVVAPQETPEVEEPTPGVWEAPMQVMLGADGALLCTASVEVNGAAP